MTLRQRLAAAELALEAFPSYHPPGLHSVVTSQCSVVTTPSAAAEIALEEAHANPNPHPHPNPNREALTLIMTLTLTLTPTLPLTLTLTRRP